MIAVVAQLIGVLAVPCLVTAGVTVAWRRALTAPVGRHAESPLRLPVTAARWRDLAHETRTPPPPIRRGGPPSGRTIVIFPPQADAGEGRAA